jgi:hypothetical protein
MRRKLYCQELNKFKRVIVPSVGEITIRHYCEGAKEDYPVREICIRINVLNNKYRSGEVGAECA